MTGNGLRHNRNTQNTTEFWQRREQSKTSSLAGYSPLLRCRIWPSLATTRNEVLLRDTSQQQTSSNEQLISGGTGCSSSWPGANKFISCEEPATCYGFECGPLGNLTIYYYFECRWMRWLLLPVPIWQTLALLGRGMKTWLWLPMLSSAIYPGQRGALYVNCETDSFHIPSLLRCYSFPSCH
jgi:hypothetical protein